MYSLELARSSGRAKTAVQHNPMAKKWNPGRTLLRLALHHIYRDILPGPNIFRDEYTCVCLEDSSAFVRMFELSRIRDNGFGIDALYCVGLFFRDMCTVSK